MIRHHLSEVHRRYWRQITFRPPYPWSTTGQIIKRKRAVRHLQNNGTTTSAVRLGQMHIPATQMCFLSNRSSVTTRKYQSTGIYTAVWTHVQTCWLPNKRVRHLCRRDHKGITKRLSTPKNSYNLNESPRRDRSKGWHWQTWFLLAVWQSPAMGRRVVS